MKHITFLFRTLDQLKISLYKLRKRYKNVKLIKKLYNGWYNGYFIVEGNGVRYLKYNVI